MRPTRRPHSTAFLRRARTNRTVSTETLESRILLTAEIEPNNTLAEATRFNTNDDTLEGNVSGAGDVDYFVASFNRGETFEIRTPNLNNTTFGNAPIPKVTIMDSSGEVKAVSDDQRTLRFTIPYTGEFYVRFDNDTVVGPIADGYAMQTLVDPIGDSTSEIEPNDDTASATDTNGRAHIHGDLSSSNAQDYFHFDGSAGETAIVQFSDAPYRSPSVRLYSPGGELRASSLNGYGLTHVLDETGQWFVEIGGDNLAGPIVGGYVARIDTITGFHESGSNIDFNSATPWDIESDTWAIGELSTVGVPSVFKFEVTDLDAPRFRFNDFMTRQNRELRVFNEKGQFLQYNYDGDLDRGRRWSGQPIYAGTYYLVVSASSDAGLGPFALSRSMRQVFSYQRDTPLYFLDFDEQDTHLGFTWVAPFQTPEKIPLARALFESRYDIFDVDVTETLPDASVGEYVGQGIGDFGNFGAGGLGGGSYGNRRPQGDGITGNDGSGWSNLSSGSPAPTLMHEAGHATGVAHARHPLNLMAYTSSAEWFPVGSFFPFSGTDQHNASPYTMNVRDYFDWVLSQGIQVFETEGNDSLLTAQNLDIDIQSMQLEHVIGTDVTTGSSPGAVRLGKLNGDDNLDLVYTDVATNRIFVRMGNGDGTFGGASSVASGGGNEWWSKSLTLNDFNGDGNLDVAHSSQLDSNVTVFFGNGGGSLGAGTTYPTTGGIVAIESADLNGDGRPELALAGDGFVSVMINNGDGTFVAAPDLTLPSTGFDIHPVDLNRDSRNDLVTANGDGSVTVFMNDGAGFTETTFAVAGAQLNTVTAADFDGNGVEDVAVAGMDNTLYVLEGDDLGGLTVASTAPTNNQPWEIDAIDMGLDGLADIVASSFDEQTLVYPSGGSLFFGESVPVGKAGNGTVSQDVGDLNDDGFPDVVSSNNLGGRIFVTESSEIGDPDNDRAVVYGRLEDRGDVDVYSISATADETWVFDVDSAEYQYGLDSWIRIYDAGGNLLATNHDARDGDTGVDSVDPWIEYTFTEKGRYFVSVAGEYSSRGSYRLKVTPSLLRDDEGPRIMYSSPAPGSTNNSTKQLLFFVNDQIDPTTLDNIQVVGQNEGPQSGTATFDPMEQVIIWTADQPLPDDIYDVTVGQAITDLAGNALDGETDGLPNFPEVSGDDIPGGNFTTSFEIVGADNAPATLSVVNVQRHVYNRHRIILQASDELDIPSVQAEDFMLVGGGVSIPLDSLNQTYQQNNRLVLYTRGVADAGNYQIVGNVLDAAGHAVPISLPVTLNSVTRAHGPSVTGMTPMPGGTAYAATNQVEVFFSGALETSSLTANNVKLFHSVSGDFSDGTASEVAGTAITWDASRNAAIITSPNTLENGYYRVALSSGPNGIENVSGRMLDGEFLDSFIPGTTVPNIWLNAPSGDGRPGGDFSGEFTVALPELEIESTVPSVIEDAGPGGLEIMVSRFNDDPSLPLTVSLSSDDLTEIQVPSTITFPANVFQMTVPVDVIDDSLLDGTITVAITATAVGYISDSSTVDVEDNETAQLILTETDAFTEVDETGTTDTFEVSLSAEPFSQVVVTFTAADPTEALVSPMSFTFDASNWNVPQQITVTGEDDPTVDGSVLSDIVVSVDDANSDDEFDNAADITVVVTTTDDDIAAFDVAETGVTIVAESGTTDTFSVVLPVQPLSDVVISLTATDLGEAIIDLGSLTFTPANWDQSQTVTVMGVDDLAVDGDVTSSIQISVDDAQSDDAFDLIPNQLVVVITTDDEVPGFVIDESSGQTVVGEAGLTDDFTIVLPAQPLGNVVFSLTSPDVSEAVVSPARVTFNSTNWNVPQTVQVAGPDDQAVDGNQVTDIVISVLDNETTDGFDGMPDQTVRVITIDDEAASLTVTLTNGTNLVSEAGSVDVFTVVLPVQPLSDVVISLESSDEGEVTVTPQTLTFTPTNWSNLQTVTLIGEDDDSVDGPQFSNVVVKVVDDQSDDAFDDIADISLDVTTTDNEIAGFIVTEPLGSITISETGIPDSFEVELRDRPLSDVVLTVESSDLSEANVSPATLTFTPSNWNIRQSVTVSGVADSVVDGDQTADVVVKVLDSQSDDAFDGLLDQTVVVTVLDEQVAAYAVNESDGSTSVSESGTGDTFSVALVNGPLSNVVFEVTSLDEGEATVSVSRLTFTPTNWASAQTVIVTGADDPTIDGDQTFDIVVKVIDAETDDFFDGLPDQTIEVTTTDDDVPAFTVTETVGSTVVGEDGSTDFFSVALPVQPLTDVVLLVTSTDTSEATVTPATLTFTPDNWNTSQNVVVTGVDDAAVDGTRMTDVVVEVVDSASDDAFDNLASQTVVVETSDDDLAAYDVVETGAGTSVSEDGQTDSFDIVLPVQPLTPVIFQLTISDPSEVETSVGLVTFTPDNWATPQTVTVTGADDDAVDGDVTSPISINVWDQESDASFHSLPDSTISVITSDDDVPGLVVTETNGFTRTRESGTTDDIHVSLEKQPAGVVTVAIDVASTDIAVSNASLTFTPADWNTPQAVTISSVDDNLMDGSQIVAVTASVDAAQSDATYHSASPVSIDVLSVDDDSPVFLDHDILYVDGTDGQDVVLVSQTGTTIDVDLNGAQYSFDSDDFRKIRIQTYKANDLVRAETVTMPLHVSLANGRDEFHGGPGADTVNGGGGYDLVFGYEGNDKLSTGNGQDTIWGGPGNDRIRGGGQADTLYGEAGNDDIGGGGGRDMAFGGDGDDRLVGDQNRDTLHGDAGHDTLFGGAGNDSLSGGAGHDLVDGGNLDDVLRGDEGRDFVIGGKGIDDIDAGTGDDIVLAGGTTLNEAGLFSILEEWTSSRTYDQRVANIVDSGVTTPDRLNTAFLIGADRPATQTAIDDFGADDLTGGNGSDLFFASLSDDVLQDRELTEWLHEL